MEDPYACYAELPMREGLMLHYDIYRCGVTGFVKYALGLDGQWYRYWHKGWITTGVSGVPTRILWHAVLAWDWC